MESSGGRKRRPLLWLIAGAALLLGMAAFVAVSLGYGPPRFHLWVLVLTTLAHTVVVWRLASSADSRWRVAYILLVGLLLRATLFLMPTARTSDYHRYLWDGALVAHGISPYRWTPEQALEGKVPPDVRRLATEGRAILEGVNHPDLRTIYPPVAQAFFALSYWLKPFSPGAWRVFLLALDLAAFVLIWRLLKTAALPLAWLTAYFWNPLLLVETYHNRHVDLVMAPFLALLIWGLWRKRPWLAGLGLSLAAAVKIWPALLFPFLVWRFAGDRRRLVQVLAISLISAALLFLPYWASLGSETTSGTLAYAQSWRANELAFQALYRAGRAVEKLIDYRVAADVIARTTVMALLLAASCWLAAKTRRAEVADLARAASAVVLLMLLVGPTVYPWYFTPAVVLAGLSATSGVIAWTVFLPLTALSGSRPSPSLPLIAVHLVGWLLFAAQLWHFQRLENRRNA
jgi:alpha-1,6-mannosyltransferase